ncbi:MAG TPA: interleukin-like EMT inducer domain-containing protein [Candidatus Limnocylindrales bacterium]|nr:interleukin-like EMT inducer domain-containing protein [Candidatus Limnocylindrales bacterium]
MNRKEIFFIFLILLGGYGSFQNTLPNYFVADDFFLIYPYTWKEVLLAFGGEGLANHRDRERPILGTPATDEEGTPILFNETYYRPVVRLSAFIDRQIWGFNPFGYHLTNLFLHLLSALVIYFWVKILLSSSHSGYIAWVVSLLFVTHPVHTEAVTWLSGRVDVLCSFFYLLSVLLFTRYLHSPPSESLRFRIFLLSGSIGAFIGALMSKEMAITLPLVLFLIDWMIGEKPFLSKLKRLSPFFFILAVYLVLRFILLGGIGGYLNPQGSVHLKWGWFMVSILVWYARQLLFPFEAILPSHMNWIQYLLLFPYSLSVYALFRMSRIAGLACLWIPVTLLPVMNIAAERFLYLPSVGFLLFLGLGLGQKRSTGDRPVTPTKEKLFLRSLYLPGPGYLMIGILTLLNLFTTREKNERWHHAGEMVQEIQNQMKSLYPTLPRGAHLFFLDLPDNYQGAYVYRNGIAGSMRLIYRDYSLQADPLISLLQLKPETFIKGQHFLFHYQTCPEPCQRKGQIVHRKDWEDFLVKGERFPSKIGKTGIEAPVDLIVQSAGLYAGNLGVILVNGQAVSPQSRGYNVVVVNPQTGRVEESTAFDTHRWQRESRRMAKFIGKLEEGKIVILALKDEGALCLTTEAVEALKTIGAQEDLRGRLHWSHAVIGIKGAKPGEALEESSSGPVKLEVAGKR